LTIKHQSLALRDPFTIAPLSSSRMRGKKSAAPNFSGAAE
jgi:hypothetical protein